MVCHIVWRLHNYPGQQIRTTTTTTTTTTTRGVSNTPPCNSMLVFLVGFLSVVLVFTTSSLQQVPKEDACVERLLEQNAELLCIECE